MFALVGSSLAFMLSDYQNKQLNVEYPFDIILISDNTENDFAKEETLINENTVPRATLKYCVYQNGTSEMVDYLYQNLSNAIKLTRNNQIAAIWEEGYREGTYMGEMRLSAMMGRGKLRSGRQGRSFRSKRGSMSRNQPRKVWQQR